MGILSKHSARTFHKNGNSKIWFFLIIVGIGLFLHYREKKEPWRAFKQDVSGVFGKKEDNSTSPTLPKYNDSAEDIATDDRREQAASSQTEEESSQSAASDAEEEPTEAESQSTEAIGFDSSSQLDQYLPSTKSGEQVVRHKGYVLSYVEEHEQAGWVVHLLKRNARNGKAKRAREFKPDPLVRTNSALPQDYSRSGYDRGHLAPAGDFKYDQILTYETFYMSNMSPQKPELNQGIWNDMEIKIRDWAAERGDLVIVTGPVLKSGLEKIGRSNDVSVPEQYYKIVFDPSAETAIAFLMSNQGHYELLRNFVVSIDEIEKITGYDFFPKLPDTLERKIESKRNTSEWY